MVVEPSSLLLGGLDAGFLDVFIFFTIPWSLLLAATHITIVV
jgi:hypothetical protein